MIIWKIFVSYSIWSCCLILGDELFERDFGNDIEIGITENYEKVELMCGSQLAHVYLNFYEKFYGVIYTRGHFYNRNSPCFFDYANKNKKEINITIPLEECLNKQNGEVFSNVLVVQHDTELIMPGDMAFLIDCDFTRSKEFTVTTSIKSDLVRAKLVLTDPDPSKKVVTKSNENQLSGNASHTVILIPKKNRIRSEEL